jgi:cysteine desulfurase
VIIKESASDIILHMQIKDRIYLDYAATTPVDERVLVEMLPYFRDAFGNPSSIHAYGQQADAAIENARYQMAEGLNCEPGEFVFTSCGSESDNLALRGVAFAMRQSRQANHILVPPTEHHAVTRTAQQLASIHGFDLEYLPVDEYGRTSAADVAARLRPDTALVSVMYANNEIGTINPISEIGAVCRQNGVPFHTDAVQAAAYLPVDVKALNVDLLSLGAHKFYGPKGVGGLYKRKGIPMLAQQTGGSQELGLRAGTSNTPYITAMAKAFSLAQEERNARTDHVRPLRDQLIGRVLEEIPETRLTGDPLDRLPNHASFVFRGVDGNALLMLLDLAGFACSSGSACKTGDPEPSEVLIAMGFDREWALGSLRITLGTGTTPQQVNQFIEALPQMVARQRSLSH